MTELIVSLSSSGNPWTGPLSVGQGRIGYASLGLMGFIDYLETQLGLKVPSEASHKRKMDYLRALDVAQKKQNLFYSKSFATDPAAVAEDLLQFRDQLIAAGWKPTMQIALEKIRHLSVVESKFSNRSGLIDRVIRIHAELGTRDKLHGLREVFILDPKSCLSDIWLKILEQDLPRLNVMIRWQDFNDKPICQTSSDLARFLSLRSVASVPVGDESIALLAGRDPWDSARLISAYMASLTDAELEQCLVVAPRANANILRSAMLARGIPFGMSDKQPSFSRPALQLFVLAMGLVWYPKDPSFILSLIGIAESPIHSAYRYKLLKLMSQSLNIDGEQWTQKVDEIFAELKQNPNIDGEIESLNRSYERTKAWLFDRSAEPQDGIDSDVLVRAVDRVARWLLQKWQVSSQNSYFEAYEICRVFSALVATKNDEAITPSQLKHYMVDAIGMGVSAGSDRACAKGPIIVNSPHEVHSAVKQVIWWDFVASSVQGRKNFHFPRSDEKQLHEAGIRWMSPAAQALSGAECWITPFLRAKERILLVGHLLNAQGDPESHHPILAELLPQSLKMKWFEKTHIQTFDEGSKVLTRFLENLGATLSPEIPPEFGENLDWDTDGKAISLRGQESSSSLEKLFGCDLAYVLRYKAGLSGEDRASVQYNESDKGIIAHEVLAQVFKRGFDSTSAGAVKQAEAIIDAIILDKAPHLHKKANSGQLAWLRTAIIDDVRIYASFLIDNQLSVYGSEINIEKSNSKLGSVHLTGKVDHVLLDKNGRKWIVDHKWGQSQYKEKDLTEGRGFQLALYTRLLDEPTVGLAYHMITDNKIFILNQDMSGSYTVNGPTQHEILKKAEVILAQRVKTLELGKVSALGLKDNAESADFNPGCRFCDYSKICGLAWRAQ